MPTRIALIVASLLACLAFGCEDDGQMAVTNINPQQGNAAGLQRVMITGRNFRQDISYSVFFGKEKAKSVTIKDPQNLIVQTPKSDPGVVDITIRADDGNAFRIKQAYTFMEVAAGGNENKSGNLKF